MKKENLSELSPGECGIIKKILVEDTIRRRLFDIGLIEGTKVCCTLSSFGGDPMAFSVRGGVIALRKSDLKNILIEETEEKHEEKK